MGFVPLFDFLRRSIDTERDRRHGWARPTAVRFVGEPRCRIDSVVVTMGLTYQLGTRFASASFTTKTRRHEENHHSDGANVRSLHETVEKSSSCLRFVVKQGGPAQGNGEG
jgi:hypothetical protein